MSRDRLPNSASWKSSVHRFSLSDVGKNVLRKACRKSSTDSSGEQNWINCKLFIDFGDLAGNSSHSTLGQIVYWGRRISTVKLINPQHRTTKSHVHHHRKSNRK